MEIFKSGHYLYIHYFVLRHHTSPCVVSKCGVSGSEMTERLYKRRYFRRKKEGRRLPERMRKKYVSTYTITICAIRRHQSITKQASWRTHIKNNEPHKDTHVAPVIIIFDIEVRLEVGFRSAEGAE